MYSLDKLLFQFWNSFSMSGSNCCFLTDIQVSQETGKMVWYSHLFKNFSLSVVIDTVKSFHVVNEAEVDVFLEFPCFLYDATNVGSLITGSSVFSKPSLYIWNFLIQVLLKPSVKDFEHNCTMGNERNCLADGTFFSTALLWDWDEGQPLPVLTSWPIWWIVF